MMFEPLRQAVLVLVSALPDLAAEASRLGVDGYLRKPFGLDAVVQIALRCCTPASAGSQEDDGAVG